MNREEILAKSQKENHNKLDERSKNIQTKANSISQGVGMILCILTGAIALGIRKDAAFLWCVLTIFWGMFAAERIVCAVKEKTAGQWVLAAIITLGSVAAFVIYFLTLTGIIGGVE